MFHVFPSVTEKSMSIYFKYIYKKMLKIKSYIQLTAEQLKIHDVSMSVVHFMNITTEMIKPLQYINKKCLMSYIKIVFKIK